MKTIWKFGPIPPGEATYLDVPLGAKIRFVGTQGGHVHFWAEVDDAAPKIRACFLALGTGWDIDEAPKCDYVGTTMSGPFVWHLYAVRP